MEKADESLRAAKVLLGKSQSTQPFGLMPIVPGAFVCYALAFLYPHGCWQDAECDFCQGLYFIFPGNKRRPLFPLLKVQLMFKMESHMMESAIAVGLDLIGVLADHIA